MKNLFCLFLMLVSLSVFCAVPQELRGIWKGNDRYLFFGGENQIAILLNEYYGWYLDRAVEPEEFSKLRGRRRNLATSKNALHCTAEFVPIPGYQNLWELNLKSDGTTLSVIPLVLKDDALYLSFLLKIPYDVQPTDGSLSFSDATFFTDGSGTSAYWQGMNTSDAIRLFPRNDAENVISWYITKNAVYRLRFWKTDMPFEQSKAAFADGNTLFTVNKHILSAGQNYTCVNGRSSNIRNVEKYSEFPFQYTLTDDGMIMLLGKPYVQKLKDNESAEELLKIVDETNNRRKPDPPPLFPPEELDWHWDLINELEKGNAQIEAVRKRQKEFGPRAQDLEKQKK